MNRDLLFRQGTDFIVNLLLQRTGYLVQAGFGSAIADWELTGSLESLKILASDNIFLDGFIESIRSSIAADVKAICAGVSLHDGPVETLVSIGCGNGLLEAQLCQQMPVAKLYLIDIEETPGKTHHGLALEGAGYSNLEKTCSFLDDALDSPPELIATNPLKQSLPSDINADLIISILSAGFHYPMSSYKEFVAANLCPGGFLVFDQRITDMPFMEFSLDGLENLTPCLSTPKYRREVFRRSAF